MRDVQLNHIYDAMENRFALPKGPGAFGAPVFAFIRSGEYIRLAPEMQKPRISCGAFVARPGFEPVLIINEM